MDYQVNLILITKLLGVIFKLFWGLFLVCFLVSLDPFKKQPFFYSPKMLLADFFSGAFLCLYGKSGWGGWL